MRHLRVAIILIVVAALFVFLVPLVPVTLNLCRPMAPSCLPSLYRDHATVSIAYYGLGIGGRILATSYSGENTFQILFWPGWVCDRAIASTCNQVMWSS
jgi:hypothetical protein